jgi:hypothetical protein
MPLLLFIVAAVFLILYFGLSGSISHEITKDDMQVWIWDGEGKEANKVKSGIKILDDSVVFESLKDGKNILEIPYTHILNISDHIPRQWSDRSLVYLICRGQIAGPATRNLSFLITYKGDSGTQKVEKVSFKSGPYFRKIRSILREKSPDIVTMDKVKGKTAV